MIRWFRRSDPDDEFEDDDYVPLPDHVDFGAEPAPVPGERPLPEVPELAVIVAAAATNGWHMAAVLAERTSPDFYLRAITVKWPFVVARPLPSSRASDRRYDRASLSPTGSTPARKLVVNWGWMAAEGAVSQLRFYIKRNPNLLLFGAGRATVRLTLKESGWPRRRIVVPARSNVIAWGAATPPRPASSPQSIDASAHLGNTGFNASDAAMQSSDTAEHPSETPGDSSKIAGAPPAS